MAKAVPTPPSSKYRFNPEHEDARVSIPLRRWVVTADELTDQQAEFMLRRGTYGNLIVTKAEAEKIRKGMGAKSASIDGGYAKNTIAELKVILDEAGVDHSGADRKADYVALAEGIED